ncbi:hypothetical protein NM688_g5455 [Phlebia brevispora]|uniref:Uncharacterized protein n=1 Tax=Phlebia brevispora TaxID=194682 RepID=A0ACC1SV90_9APHY|nr:hypothetical protein NM688_g5455 [Phlebia brevispora]
MASLPKRTDILIVGGGPTGLAAALSLYKHGCKDILVVDSIVSGENTSRAMVVHAATMDARCAESLANIGVKVNGTKVWDGYRFHEEADFSTLAPHTKFPFLLLCPQHITERILGERVRDKHISVHRPLKVVDLKVNESDINLTDVVFEDGQIVQARYVIGADGARSTVRHCAGIGYADPDGEDGDHKSVAEAVIADVIFESPPPRGEELVVGEEVWRMSTGVTTGVPPPSPPIEYLQGLVDAQGPGSISVPNRAPLKIKELLWSTRFRTRSDIASTCFTRLAGGSGGVILLVGDAAHRHPPAGGQGMNLGLRDAIFLGPILAEQLRQSAQGGPNSVSDEPLKAWAKDRHAKAVAIIHIAKTMLGWACSKDQIVWYYGLIPVNWVRIRNLALWVGDTTGLAKKILPWRLSGLMNR